MINDHLIVKDDPSSAIDDLIQFNKKFCIDLEKTVAFGSPSEPCFRCNGCQFNQEGICLMKLFIFERGSQKQIADLKNNLIPNKIFKGGKTDELNS